MESYRQLLGGLHLQEYQYLLMAGHPPLYMQLAIANSLVLALWLFGRLNARRQQARARGANRHQQQLKQQQQRAAGGMMMTGFLVMANVGVLMASQWGA